MKRRPPNIQTNLFDPTLVTFEKQTESIRKYIEYNMERSFIYLPDGRLANYDFYSDYIKQYC